MDLLFRRLPSHKMFGDHLWEGVFVKPISLASLRAAPSRSAFAILALTLVLLTAVSAGIAGYYQLAATEAFRSLATAPGSQGYFRVHSPAAGDGAQRTAVDDAVADLGLAGGLELSTAAYSPPRPLVPSGGSATNLPADLTVMPVEGVPTTTPTAGSLTTFPSYTPAGGGGTVPAAMHAAMAQSLNLSIGDTFAVEGADGTVRLELVATLDPVGADAALLGPIAEQDAGTVPTAVVVPPGTLAAFSGDHFLQWVLTVDGGGAPAADMTRLADGLRTLPTHLADQATFDDGISASGELPALLDSAADADRSVESVLPIALGVPAVSGLLTVALLARLMVPSRRVFLVAAGACVLGWGAAVVLVPLVLSGGSRSHPVDVGGFVAATWPVPLLCAAGAVVVLVGAQALRRRFPSVVVVVLVAATIGLGSFAAAYSETLKRSLAASAQLANGSDVRVQLPDVPVAELPPLESFAVESVSAQSWAYHGDVQVASEAAELVAVDAASLPRLLGAGSDLIDVEELAGALAYEPPVPEPALALLPSASQIRLQLTSVGTSEPGADDGSSRPAAVTAWIRTQSGVVVPVSAGTLALSGTAPQAHSLSFSLPEGLRPAAVAAIDVALGAAGNPGGYDLELAGVSSDGGIGNGQSRLAEDSTLRLAPDAFGAGLAGVVPLDDGVGVRFTAGPSRGEEVQARLVADASAAPLPVAVSASLLAELGLSAGDSLPLRVGQVEIPAVVAAESPIVPGTTEAAAVLVDWQAYSLASLTSASAPPSPGEIWLAAADPAGVAAGLAAGAGVVVETGDSSVLTRFTDPAGSVLWISSVGTLILGSIGLALTILKRSRPARPSLLGTAAIGIVFGLAAGFGSAALIVPAVVRPTIIGAANDLQVPLAAAAMPLLVLVVVQVVVLIFIARARAERGREREADKAQDGSIPTRGPTSTAAEQESTMIEVPAEYSARDRREP